MPGAFVKVEQRFEPFVEWLDGRDSASKQSSSHGSLKELPSLVAMFASVTPLAAFRVGRARMPEHRVYVEPFGGMAGVLLKKEQSEVEVFNDLDGRAVNFFRVIRDRELFEELKLCAELTPYSREEFQILCETPEPTEPVQRAWWFFVRCRQARGGTGMGRLTPNAWATSTRSRRQMPEPISKYLSALDGLEEVANRFRQVMIENTPAIHLIKKYDGPDVLFYCDPPYPSSTRSGGKADSFGQLLGFIIGIRRARQLHSTEYSGITCLSTLCCLVGCPRSNFQFSTRRQGDSKKRCPAS